VVTSYDTTRVTDAVYEVRMPIADSRGRPIGPGDYRFDAWADAYASPEHVDLGDSFLNLGTARASLDVVVESVLVELDPAV
jgi:hypothetical protein